MPNDVGEPSIAAFSRMLARIVRVHGRHVLRHLVGQNISPGQPPILNYLVNHAGCIQREISVDNDLEPATVTNLLAGMERIGLVRREGATEDRRRQRVYLTSRGRQALVQAEKAISAVEEICFRGFSAQERQYLIHMLGRIHENLKE